MPIDIAIDLEGTMADIHTPFIQVYNTKHGTNYTINDIRWDFTGPIKAPIDEFFDITCDLWMKTPEKILPTERNIRGKIDELRNYGDRGCRIDILTEAKVLERFETQGRINVHNWLDSQMKLYPSSVINLEKGKNKLEFDRDICVDDSPVLAEKVPAYMEKLECPGLFLLYDSPWNTHIKNSKYVKRIFSLSEVLKYAKKF